MSTRTDITFKIWRRKIGLKIKEYQRRSKNMEKVCLFVSRRTGDKCGSKVVYLDSFCEKHKSTAQAALYKKELSAQLKKPAKEETNVEVMDDTASKITIFRNIYGRFEEPITHIVFDQASEKAFGVQGKKGELLPLSSKHLKICKNKGWKTIEDKNMDYLSD